MIHRRGRHLRLAAWLGLAALAVQALLPLLVAAEIRVLAADPLLAFDPATLCLHAAAPSQDGEHRHQSPSGSACPICLAFATALPVSAPVQPPQPLPRGLPIFVPMPLPTSHPGFALLPPYAARAPPALS